MKKKKLFNTVAIVGVGLIGGSLGLAIKQNKLADRVIGVGHRKHSIKKAVKKRAIDKGTLSLKSGLKKADLVILAAPVGLILDFLKKIPSYLKPGALVIDVGSTKEEIVETAENNLSPNNPFIGCHPIAGSEKRGIETAKGDIFNQAVCIITPGKHSKLKAVKKTSIFWKRIGAKVEIVSPRKHDRLLASISHLPHLAAAGLVLEFAKDNNSSYLSKFIGSGFKDTTRIAASSSLIWQDICFSNRANIIKRLKDLRKILTELENFLKKGQKKEFINYLAEAKRQREKIK